MLLFETVLSTVIYLFAGIGLGAWVPIKSISGRVMVGSAMVPVILLVLNIGTGLTLSDIALLISGSSVIGCIWFFRTVRKQENLWSLTNPVLVLPVLFIGSLLSFHEVGYQVFDWDEFASWLYWAKELYLADSLAVDGLSLRGLGYPQGWPVTVAFPQFYFPNFNPLRSIGIGVIWHACVLGLAYEVFISYLRRVEWGSNISVVLTGQILIFILLAAETFRTLVPQNFLVELPQIYILSSALLLACLAAIGNESNRGVAFSIGILLAAGTLIKISIFAAIPAISLIILYLGGRIINFQRNTYNWPSAFIGLFLFLIPIGLVQLVWIGYSGSSTSNLSSLDISFKFQHEHSELFVRLIEAGWNYIKSWKLPLTLLAALGLIYGFTKPTMRPVVIGLLVFYICYLAGLFQLYAFRFGSYEVAELQSHQRYLRVPLRVTHLLGVTFFTIMLCDQMNVSNFDVRRLFSIKSVNIIAALSIVVLFGYQVVSIRDSLSDIKLRTNMSPDRVAVINSLQEEHTEVLVLINNLGSRPKGKFPVVALIAQGDDGFAFRVVRFLALANRRGEERSVYKILPGYSWGNGPWMAKITSEQLVQRLRAADIVWGHRKDDWIEVALKPLASTCKEGVSWRFLVKKSTPVEEFECIQ